MRALRAFWSDETGGVIAAEYLLLGGVVILGTIPGFLAVRSASNEALAQFGQTLQFAVPSTPLPQRQSTPTRPLHRAGSHATGSQPFPQP